MKKLFSLLMALCLLCAALPVAAENADICALFFDGEIISEDTPGRFFAENSFYTTAANRMARGLWRYAVTTGGVVARCERERGR